MADDADSALDPERVRAEMQSAIARVRKNVAKTINIEEEKTQTEHESETGVRK